jgi:hypothetical protein
MATTDIREKGESKAEVIVDPCSANTTVIFGGDMYTKTNLIVLVAALLLSACSDRQALRETCEIDLKFATSTLKQRDKGVPLKSVQLMLYQMESPKAFHEIAKAIYGGVEPVEIYSQCMSRGE